MNVYQQVPLRGKSFMQKLLGQVEHENAVLELNNLLATVPVRDITPGQVLAISKRYKINFTRDFERNMDEMYAAYVKHCLVDRRISEGEMQELIHLKSLLGLNDTKVGVIHEKMIGAIYRATYAEVVADGRLSDEEEDFLKRLETELRLSKDLASKISEEVRTNRVSHEMDKITADGRVSDEEEGELNAICKSLNVSLQMDEKSKAALNKMKILWRTENLPLPVLSVDIGLQKGEICHYRIHALWQEYRGGTRAPELKVIDRGMLYLTNKRVILVGEHGNKNIALTKIFSVEAVSEGVLISKDAGKNPVLYVDGDAEIVSRILLRLVRGF